MKPQKTAIIGAGIVGLYLALKLSEKGNKVTVFEKKGSIGKLACSGLFSEKILKFIPESQKLVQNKIEFALIHFPKKTVKIKFSEPFLVMSHAELDRVIADLARKAGAKIVLNNSVDSLPEGFDRTIGCDGAYSFVRKNLGLKEPKYRLGILGFVSKKDNSNYVETWAVKDGFIWKIPRGEETEYGIIAGPKDAKMVFDEFLKKNDIQVERILSAVVPQGFLIPKNSSVTICGDSAGLTKPWSGGGVIWGLIAADILVSSFPDFSKYCNKMKRYFKFRIYILKMLTKAVYFLGFNFPLILPKNIKIESDAIFTSFIKLPKKNK